MSAQHSLQMLLRTSEKVSDPKNLSYAQTKTKELLSANKAAADVILLRLQRELRQELDINRSSVEICNKVISYDK